MILTNLLATTKAIMIVKMMATPPVAQFVIPESVRSKEEDEMTLMMLKTLAGDFPLAELSTFELW